jgi:predicted SAM-dependent methyltransferase
MLTHLKNWLRPTWHRIRRPRWRWPSETSKCRPRLAPYCTGYGIDVGCGGDPITPAAVRVDLPQPYASYTTAPVQLGGDAGNLYWFKDDTLDFVYSSHVLEDFPDTAEILREWLRVLKPGGRLVIFCPDEQRFRTHCAKTGQPYNTHHQHAHFSLEFVKGLLAAIGGTRVVYENPNVDIYSWDLVVEKSGAGRTGSA